MLIEDRIAFGDDPVDRHCFPGVNDNEVLGMDFAQRRLDLLSVAENVRDARLLAESLEKELLPTRPAFAAGVCGPG